MAIPLKCDTPRDGGFDATVEFPREAMAYLAKAWEPGGQGSGPAVSSYSGELVARIRMRDVEAFEALVHLSYAPLVHFARGFVGSREAAEDVVQDVLAAVWERADRWVPAGNPATYLFGMVRHQAIDVLRRRTSESRRHLRVARDADAARPSPEQDVIDAEEALRAAARLRLVETLLATLSERQRTAYDLRYRQGMTIPEVAQVLGVTVKGAEQLVGRMVRAIRERMRALEGELGEG